MYICYMIHCMDDSFIRFIYISKNKATKVGLHKRIAFSANKISGICTQWKLSLTLLVAKKMKKQTKNIKNENKQTNKNTA